MSKLIGFIGKGGTGKSTLTALFLKYVLQKNVKPILVIDADPNACLGELIGLHVENTIGNIRQKLLNKKYEYSASISKYDYCEYALNNAIVESKGFDLIVMGRSDGPGCYCYVNNIVKLMIEKLKKNYQLIIVDCEAGLEHLSRRTLGDINISFIIADLSRKGILTGVKQVELMKELEIQTDKNYLLINDVIDEDKTKDFEKLIKESNNEELKYLGIIHHDENILKYELNQNSLLDLPDDSKSYRDLRNIVDEINLFKT
ncbi:MAG: AAA family ATPase [Candidatus Cloacimonetes bacterium]|nr:AAA family ATPase [Candidatus Cloacimonadota bacterium]